MTDWPTRDGQVTFAHHARENKRLTAMCANCGHDNSPTDPDDDLPDTCEECGEPL